MFFVGSFFPRENKNKWRTDRKKTKKKTPLLYFFPFGFRTKKFQNQTISSCELFFLNWIELFILDRRIQSLFFFFLFHWEYWKLLWFCTLWWEEWFFELIWGLFVTTKLITNIIERKWTIGVRKMGMKFDKSQFLIIVRIF